MIGARTRVFALLGDPVAHSLSPAMQNAAFRVTGLDACYVALRAEARSVAPLATALAMAGGGGNVTVPHKRELLMTEARASELVTRVGAANTFWGEGGTLAIDNTDVTGILAALDRVSAPATRWLILGTGGSARAVAAAAVERGAAIAVRSRDPSRASEFLRWAAGIGVAEADARECEVVVNATPLGLDRGDALPSQPGDHPAVTAAVDLVYAGGGTRWVRALAEGGVRAVDGREVLIAQGATAFARWFPKVTPPVEAMRGAVERALG